MARFNYKLQGVLNLRMQQEEQVKMEFAVANKNLNDQIDILEELKRRKEEYIQEGYALRNENRMNVREIVDNNYAEKQMDVMIQDQQVVVESYRAKYEVARIKLTKAIQERKMQEKLREKAFAIFIEEEKEAEAKETDERSSFVYTKRAREGE
ncbi:flagellar export protein FliJ [Butyrivibrio sp. NC2002]|jgi:flagellar FliJ protein|uniref:flagellar export protein FliJ n=1 Tax=Butyrivibrio sp. NC2002 TaxID=1410610 RepID=UPI00055DB4BA|nr:flagellar export protein FliJ [Butyrivibrio sp. NC2002]